MGGNETDNKKTQEFQIAKAMWLETYQSAIDAHCATYQKILSESFKAMFEYSKIAINGAFLLNGSAAAAIMYNSYSVGDKWKHLALYCALGAVLAVACAAISYIAQKLYFRNDTQNCQKAIDIMYTRKFTVILDEKPSEEKLPLKSPILANVVSFIACLSLAASLYLFCYSLYNAVAFANMTTPL